MRIVFGDGSMERLGVLARELGFSRTLIVADQGIVAAGFVARAARLLESSGIVPAFFHDFDATIEATARRRNRCWRRLAFRRRQEPAATRSRTRSSRTRRLTRRWRAATRR